MLGGKYFSAPLSAGNQIMSMYNVGCMPCTHVHTFVLRRTHAHIIFLPLTLTNGGSMAVDTLVVIN